MARKISAKAKKSFAAMRKSFGKMQKGKPAEKPVASEAMPAGGKVPIGQKKSPFPFGKK